MTGIALGYSLNLWTVWLLLEGGGDTYTSQSPYVIEPPDVLQIVVTNGSLKADMSVSGDYIVGPDGTVDLGDYGSVYIAGMEVAEAESTMEEKLSDHLQSPTVVVDVLASNSKVFYVITKSSGGDSVVRVPCTGNETALDAITQIGGIQNPQKTDLWIARPSQTGTDQIMPIEWDRVASGENTSTNYRIYPGDRLFVSPKTKSVTN